MYLSMQCHWEIRDDDVERCRTLPRGTPTAKFRGVAEFTFVADENQSERKVINNLTECLAIL